MGKRKHKDKRSHGRNKNKREKRFRYYDSDSYSSSTEDEYEDDRTPYYPRRPYVENDYDLPLYDSDDSINRQPAAELDSGSEKVRCLEKPAAQTESPPTVPTVPDPSQPGTSADIPPTSLPAEILEALGNPKVKDEVFGPKIPEEIAERWGQVLVNGLTKEQKQEIVDKSLVPDNFRLVKAPLLNPEIIPVLSEPSRNRDKLLEKSQNQLGLGISRLTNLASMIIEDKTDKLTMLKYLSETSQIFLDLHYEDTKRRRKLVTSSLDKSFLNMISDVKRDSFLFGANLGEKIKTSKTAERSGLQIKWNDRTSAAARKYPHQQQGNWRGPPRSQVYRPSRPGGQRPRYTGQWSRRPPLPPPPAARQQQATKPTTKTPKP